MKASLLRHRPIRRLAPSGAARPIMTKEQILEICDGMLKMSTVGEVTVTVEHIARSIAVVANGRVEGGEDGDVLNIHFGCGYNHNYHTFETDERDPDTLRALIRRTEKIMYDEVGADQHLQKSYMYQDTFVPTHLWHDSTVEAMQGTRETLIPALMNPAQQQGLAPYGFVSFFARAKGVVTNHPTQAYSEDTDCELSVTVRTPDNTSSGWAGQAHRAWEGIDPGAVVARAIDWAKRGVNPKAFEPGRRTVILTPEAVGQLMRIVGGAFDGGATERGETPFWKRGTPSNRVGEQVFDERITLSSDPADPEGGYMSYFSDGFANPPMSWIEKGRLMHLAYDPWSAAARALTYAEVPLGFRMAGGSTSIEQMIAQCTEGILVNHFGSFSSADTNKEMQRALVVSAVTRDGCFLIKNGKIETPVKNFRFIDSPIYLLNSLVALGEPKRVAFGYPGVVRDTDYWPFRPMIVPPMMARDFNFTSLSDAV